MKLTARTILVTADIRKVILLLRNTQHEKSEPPHVGCFISIEGEF